MQAFLSKYPDVMGTHHLCEIFGCSRDTITKKVRSGEIPAKKIGKGYIFAKPLIIKLLLSDGISDIDAEKVSHLR